jgi:hypothetical protein
MEQDSYSVPEVIEALRSVGVQEEVIEYIVPIAGYESRVGGVPFVRDALDKISPSWGIFQANIDSMAPGIYQAMKELGVELPGVTDKQDKILSTNKAKLSSEKNFTEEQKKFVANWFATEADLNANALVFKYTLATKMQDISTDDFKKAIDAAYVYTTQKFADLENKDAQALKKDLENQYSEYVNTPDDIGIPEPEEGFIPGPIPSTTTTTVPETTEIDTTTRSSTTNQFGTPPQDTREPNPPKEKRKSLVDRGNEAFSNLPVGPITQKIRDANQKYGRKDSFLKYFDTVTSFRKKDPSTFKERSVAKPTEFNFMGTPVTTQEIIDLLEP